MFIVCVANAWGDSSKDWRTEPMQLSRNGMVVVPPPHPIEESSELNSRHSRSRANSIAGDRSTHVEERRSGHSDRYPGHGVRSPSPPHYRHRSDSRSLSPDGRCGRKRSRSDVSYQRDDPDYSKRSKNRGRSHAARGKISHPGRDSMSCSSASNSSSPSRERDTSNIINSKSGDAFEKILYSDYREKDRHWKERERLRNDRSQRRDYDSGDDARYAGMTGAQIERERMRLIQEKEARLSKADYRQWKDLLKHLNLSRASIKHAMGFAYDRIESAEEVASRYYN